MTPCKALTVAGKPCQAPAAMTRNGYCIMHDPAQQAVWADRRHRGGVATRQRHRRTPPPAPRTLEDVARWSAWVAWAVAYKHITPPEATAIRASLSELRATRKDLNLAAEVERLRTEVRNIRRTDRRHE